MQAAACPEQDLSALIAVEVNYSFLSCVSCSCVCMQPLICVVERSLVDSTDDGQLAEASL